jgi:hypothetical protein
LGFSEAGLSLLTDRYQRVLAQPTRRKLALLIGINQYPEQVCDCVPIRGSALNGCLTDVELQRELLMHRFGFQASDILTLTDQQATYQAIQDAFLSHLTEQARPGDVVVFHFSGLGSRILLADAAAAPQNSLVPVDGDLPTAENATISDLMEETLGLMLRSLQTDQLTTVLDTGYTHLGRTMQGNLRIRSRPNAPSGELNEVQKLLQERLENETRVSRDQIAAQWRSGQLPGVVLVAAGENQIATEAQWNGFSAGLFTYALTQQLWWTTPAITLRVSFSQAAGAVKQLAGLEQQPNLAGQATQNQVLSTDYLNPIAAMGADGVIRAIEEDGRVQLWLAGLPATVLENYGASWVAIADSSPSAIAPATASPGSAASPADADTPTAAVAPATESRSLLQIRSRDGLTLKARSYTSTATSSPKPGQLVQELIRVLPRNIGLTVALDINLERIERVDATSAFASIPRISSVIAGEQPADFLFGKARLTAQTLTASLSADALTDASTQAPGTPVKSDSQSPVKPSTKGSYGLFYLGRDVIPNTLIQDDEAIKTAVNRMTPQLRTLLATKLLRLTANRGSSRLGVRATLEMVAPQERIILQQETVRAPWKPPESKLAALFAKDGDVTLPIGSRIQYRLTNYGDRPIYFILLGLDTSGNAIALYPTPANASLKPAPEESMIPPKETLIIPNKATSASDWIIQGPVGLAETHLIFSREPLLQSYAVLEAAMQSQGDARRVSLLMNPLEVVQTVLQDLHQASAAILPKVDIPTDAYALDVNAWATLSFMYQVITV